MLRKRKKEQTASLYAPGGEDGEYAFEIEDASENVEEKVIENERKKALYKAISELHPRHARLIVLRDLEGLSYEEITRAANMNLGTVKSGISRARLALFEKLKENKELFS
jgi:RNA polymerase sigma-70 factor (ECF subfamily)